MKVLVVTGIYPPDIGGPATHADEVRRALTDRGHDVTVLTLSDEQRPVPARTARAVPRSWPWPVRTAASLAWVAQLARRYDVVYATGLDLVAVAGARLAGRPVALKVVGDPAWERGVRRGLTTASFDDFQDDSGGPLALRGMRAVRNWSARNATALLSPSPHLAARAGRWAHRNDVRVVPNGVRAMHVDGMADAKGHLRLVFVGRLVKHKHLERIITGVALSVGVHLDVVGEGPERASWQALADQLGASARVHFEGALGTTRR